MHILYIYIYQWIIYTFLAGENTVMNLSFPVSEDYHPAAVAAPIVGYVDQNQPPPYHSPLQDPAEGDLLQTFYPSPCNNSYVFLSFKDCTFTLVTSFPSIYLFLLFPTKVCRTPYNNFTV